GPNRHVSLGRSYRPLGEVDADGLETVAAADRELAVALAVAAVQPLEQIGRAELDRSRRDQVAELPNELRHGREPLAVRVDALGARAEPQGRPAILRVD